MNDDALAGMAVVSLFGGLWLFIVFGGWLIGSIVVAVMAGDRERSAFGWLVLSLLLSPYFTVLLLIAGGDHPGIRKRNEDLLRWIAASGGNAPPEPSLSGGPGRGPETGGRPSMAERMLGDDYRDAIRSRPQQAEDAFEAQREEWKRQNEARDRKPRE